MNPLIESARVAAESGRGNDAWRILHEVMQESPQDKHGQLLATFILEKEGRPWVALPMCRELAERHPDEPAVWINLGRVLDGLWLMDEAIECYQRVLAMQVPPKLRVISLVNLAAVYLQLGRFRESRQFAEAALSIEPANLKAKHNVGLSQLAAHEWRPGWMNYEASLGSPQRVAFQYNGEPRWDGKPTSLLVVHGEQGIGDEINGASMIPDAIGVVGRVVIDCDRKLAGLFRRSFPNATVYGTRGVRDGLPWAEADRKPSASTGVMQLGQFFRNRTQDFTGAAYLTPCPIRTGGWRSHLCAQQVIGVAWTGGVPQTAQRYRRWTLNDLLPLFRRFPEAHFVSLQYKDAQAEIDAFHVEHPEVDLVQYPFATLTQDYDDTAALVAACDGVFSMQTSVIHLAGAMGVPTHVGVCKVSQWRYGTEGDRMPWYGSVRLFRQREDDSWDIEGAAEAFSQRLDGESA